MIDFDKVMINSNSKPWTRANSKMYASELQLCPRRMYYYRKYPEIFETKTLGIFAVGNLFHEYVAKRLTKENPQFKFIAEEERHDLKFENGILVGRVDNIIEVDSKIIPVEVKTTGNFVYKPKIPHSLQIISYIEMMIAELGYLL